MSWFQKLSVEARYASQSEKEACDKLSRCMVYSTVCPEQRCTDGYNHPDVPETFTLKELADEAREPLGQAYSAKSRVRRKRRTHSCSS
jgi:hypothetical protein